MISAATLMIFFSSGAHSQSLLEVCLAYLQLHGVPCRSVVKIDGADSMDEIVTCQDGREWALFWVENEVAYVQPQTRHLYKWAREIYEAHPYVYGSSKPTYHAVSAGDGLP